MVSLAAKHVSECFIKPKHEVEETKQPYYLGPWDLSVISIHYIQYGLLFAKPPHEDNQEFPMDKFLESLKDSLSQTLVHFYPLVGRLATQVNVDKHECSVFIDCGAGPGARFIHAAVDMTVSDIVSPTDVPPVVNSFFDHDRLVNHDGHTRSLLSVQVTELLDGVFISCSMNHLVADGASYWHFWNMWSEIHRANGDLTGLSRPVIHNRYFSDGPTITLPFIHPDEFVTRYEAPPLRERFFHFSSDSVARLKAKAKEESNNDNISSLQALSALVWRSVVRANSRPRDQITNCRLATNNRHRLDPPLSQDYFGNAVTVMKITAKASELLQQDLGWAASLLHRSVVNYSDSDARDFFKEWFQSPSLAQLESACDSNSMMVISSPRFDMYVNEFGLGKALAVRSGFANKFVGQVTAYPGHEGGGSIDLEICLPPDQMSALELDQELMGYVSAPTTKGHDMQSFPTNNGS